MSRGVDKIVRSYSVTPHDTNPLTNGPCDALLVGVAGNVVVAYKDPVGGNVVEDTVYLAAGVWHLMSVIRVESTNTTATGIHAGYLT